MSGQTEKRGADFERLPPEVGRRWFTAGGAIAASGILLCVAAALADPHRFAYSYLTGFYFTLTLGLGAIVWVIVQHLTRAGWSVVARRQLEWIAGFLPLGAILFIPVAIFAPTLYHKWWTGAAVSEGGVKRIDEVLQYKHAFLNPTMFYVLSAVFFVVWAGVVWFFRSRSLEQDRSGDPALTSTMQKFAPPMMFLIAYTLACSGLLWLMSLDPHWYSTMWGVYIFAGSAVSSIAALALLTVALQSRGYFRAVSTVEHLHDIGKLLFAFTVFFAYIGFCQYFLIWYANISEETVFYKDRWLPDGGWQTTSASIPLLHFAVPFFWLLPRTLKRNRTTLALGATLLLVMHYVDMYWIVMPNLDEEGAHFTWIDVAGLLGPLGTMCAWLGYRAWRDPIYPLKDPRIPETLRNDNGQG